MIQNPIIAQILPAARRALEREVQRGTIKLPPPKPIAQTFHDVEVNWRHRQGRGTPDTNRRWHEAMKRRAEWFTAHPGATQRDWQRVYRKFWEREQRAKKARAQ